MFKWCAQGVFRVFWTAARNKDVFSRLNFHIFALSLLRTSLAHTNLDSVLFVLWVNPKGEIIVSRSTATCEQDQSWSKLRPQHLTSHVWEQDMEVKCRKRGICFFYKVFCMMEGHFFSTLEALHKRQVCFVYEWCKRTCFEELETIEGNWWPLDLKKNSGCACGRPSLQWQFCQLQFNGCCEHQVIGVTNPVWVGLGDK